MSDGRLNFKATIDDSDFNRKLNNMERGVNGLSFENSTKSLDSLNQKLLETKQRLQDSKNELVRLNAQIASTAPGNIKNNLLIERNALRRSINEDKAAVVGYKQEITNLNRELKKTSEGSNTLKGTLSSLTRYFGALIGIGTVVSLLRSFYDTTKQLQTLNKSMELGAKDSLAYASNMAFLKDITEQYGLELLSTSQAYNKFYIAAKNKLALEDIQLIFEKISKSASLMGMSVADQAGIFRALEQMMSKGTVQAEELRGQLGDRLPGAFEIMARSMGVTTEKLNEMMQNGEVIASEVLPKFAIELEKTFGADKVEKVDNLTAAENRLKNAWTDFVAEVNGSENVIGKILMGFSDGITDLIKDISRLTTSWSGLMKRMGAESYNKAYDSTIGSNVSKDDAVKKAYDLEARQRLLLANQARLNKELETSSKFVGSLNFFKGNRSSVEVKKDLEETTKELQKVNGQLTAYREISFGLSKDEENIDDGDKDKDKDKLRRLEELAKKRIAFVLELEKAERNLTQSTLSGLDLEKAKIEEVYQERLKKAKELKANQDALDKIESLKAQETEIVTYKAETDSIKIALEQQKKDYEDFENFKKQVGVQKASEMYKDLIDVNKTYMQSLEDEMSKIDLSKATDLEKDRFNTLFKIYQDYNIQKNEEERKALEELYIMTMSYEQKILALREEYEKKKADLSKEYTGDDLSNRLDILGKEYQEKASEMIRSFADEKGFGTAVTQGFIGATKQIILAQIESLRNYLSNAKDLTKAQIDEIEKIITGLDEKLYQANDNSENDSLRLINNQIKGLNKSLKDLEGRKAFLESLELPESKVELAEIEAQIIAINVQLDNMAGAKSRAIADEFGKLSNIFSSLSDDLENMGAGANNMFKSLSKVSGIASTISNLFADMKEFNEAQKSEGGATFSQTMSAAGGIMSAVFGVSSMIMGVFDSMEKAERKSRAIRIESYISSLEFERELAALETERLRRNAINLSDKRKESESIDNEILIKQRQLSELMKRLNENAAFYLMAELPMFGDMSFRSLFGDVGDLQVYYDKLKQMRDLGEEMTQQQKEQLALLDAFWLGNRSWEDLQKVLNNLKGDYIEDSMRAYVEQAIKIAKELEEAGYSLEDIQNMMREMATGTSIDELSNRLADAFAQGEDAVYSFGQTMEDVLKNAIVSAFKNEFIVKQMKPLFDMMGDMGIDGVYTQEELDEIRRLAQEVSANLQQQWDNVIEGLDIDFGQEELGGSARDGIKRITESQADRLTGILTGMQMDVIASRQILITSRNLLNSSLDNLIAIEFNTRRTYEGIERIETILQNNQQQSLGL